MCFHFCLASSTGIAVGIASSAATIKNCIIFVGIKKCKSLIKERKKKHDKLNNIIEVLISKSLIDSNISGDEVILIDNVLKEYDDIKKEIKNANNIKW